MRWWWPLAALAAVRVATPLAALAGIGLPSTPSYDYAPLNGDSFGYYAQARELHAALGRLWFLLPLLAAGLAFAGWALVRAWRSRPTLRPFLPPLGAVAVALALVPFVLEMEAGGAPVFGWPLVWGLPMLPWRAAGLPLDPDVAFVFGLVLSLAANAGALVATAYVGLYATGRRAVGLLGAALLAFWPFLLRPLGGGEAWENGTWNVDVGLHLYTEPLSTALVAAALALLLHPSADATRVGVAGILFGFAGVVKLSNGVVGAVLAPLVLLRSGRRTAAAFVAGGLALIPLVAAYWPLGYATLTEDPGGIGLFPFGTEYALENWADSHVFDARGLLLLAPLAVLGALAVRDRERLALLVAVVAANAVFYSFYSLTWDHPRFLFAALPALLVLGAAGAVLAVSAARAAVRGAFARSGGSPPSARASGG